MNNVIRVKCSSYPGAFFFRGYNSEKEFMKLETIEKWNEIHIPCFDELIVLDVEDCIIENYKPES